LNLFEIFQILVIFFLNITEKIKSQEDFFLSFKISLNIFDSRKKFLFLGEGEKRRIEFFRAEFQVSKIQHSSLENRTSLLEKAEKISFFHSKAHKY